MVAMVTIEPTLARELLIQACVKLSLTYDHIASTTHSKIKNFFLQEISM